MKCLTEDSEAAPVIRTNLKNATSINTHQNECPSPNGGGGEGRRLVAQCFSATFRVTSHTSFLRNRLLADGRWCVDQICLEDGILWGSLPEAACAPCEALYFQRKAFRMPAWQPDRIKNSRFAGLSGSDYCLTRPLHL